MLIPACTACPTNLPGAHRLLGQLCLVRKDYQQGIVHIEKAELADDPVLQLTLAQVYALLNRRSDAEKAAKAARRSFESLTESAPDRPEHRLGWAKTEMFLLNHERAAAILEAGVSQVHTPADTKRFHLALADVYIGRYDRVSKSNPDHLAKRLELLQQAIRVAPNSTAALAVQGDDNSDAVRAAQVELKRVLAAGNAPAVVHFLLGTAALGTENQDLAIRHLEQAFEQGPEGFAAANNLAWALAHAEAPDLERAERLIKAAFQRAPNHPEIRETRGVIYAKMGKTKEAIVDLEFALRAFPDRKSLHTALAELYENLGDNELAQQHRAMGKSIAPNSDSPSN